MRQEQGNLFFGIGIVANAPVGMIDGLLKIDQQQNGPIRRCGGSGYVATGLSGANSPTPLSGVSV
jgi:hypothetical protein